MQAESGRPEVLATIDVGTNSVLLQIARRDVSGRIEVLEDRATITRLGRGVDRTKRLDDAAVTITLGVLREYAELARAHAAPIVAVGTSAVRDAHNAAPFLDQAEQILGAPLQVITGLREAELTYLGATQGLTLPADDLCVVDVGGGSTEIVRARGGNVVSATSLDIGSVRLTERHALSAPTTTHQLEAVAADVEHALAGSATTPCTPLVAIAGTATTLAAILGKVTPYDRKRIHGARIRTDDLRALLQRMAALSLDERLALAGLDAGRADVIVAGAAVLLGVAVRGGADEVIVSDGGVRMGLAVVTLCHPRELSG